MATLGNKVILFGGVPTAAGGPDVLGDTWEWDGATWTQVATPLSPPASTRSASA